MVNYKFDGRIQLFKCVLGVYWQQNDTDSVEVNFVLFSSSVAVGVCHIYWMCFSLFSCTGCSTIMSGQTVYTQQSHIPPKTCARAHTHTQSYSNTCKLRGVGNRWSSWTRLWSCKQFKHAVTVMFHEASWFWQTFQRKTKPIDLKHQECCCSLELTHEWNMCLDLSFLFFYGSCFYSSTLSAISLSQKTVDFYFEGCWNIYIYITCT